ncbi:MAG: hypothetical protein IKE31_07015 [Eubacterium sp.]|nr:hypothetical protein [Eubacterium sp.]
MFDKFGEMTCQEINELAENLFNENDIDSLQAMAKENGLQDYVDDYIHGNIFNLCDPLTAALGKLEIEKADLKPTHLMKDWVSYIEGQCLENDDVAAAVRKKGKSLKGCIAELLKYSFSNRIKVDQEIVKAAGVNGARVEFGVPGMGEAKRIIRDYYLGG